MSRSSHARSQPTNVGGDNSVWPQKIAAEKEDAPPTLEEPTVPAPLAPVEEETSTPRNGVSTGSCSEREGGEIGTETGLDFGMLPATSSPRRDSKEYHSKDGSAAEHVPLIDVRNGSTAIDSPE